MHRAARLSAVVIAIAFLGLSACLASEASETQPLPAPGQTDPLDEARKNPQAVETLLFMDGG
jgi:hypothetical protein